MLFLEFKHLIWYLRIIRDELHEAGALTGADDSASYTEGVQATLQEEIYNNRLVPSYNILGSERRVDCYLAEVSGVLPVGGLEEHHGNYMQRT